MQNQTLHSVQNNLNFWEDLPDLKTIAERSKETPIAGTTVHPLFVHLIFTTHPAMKTTSVEEFYNHIATPLPDEISKEIGHFNVFRYEDVIANLKIKPVMPYNRRAYYKISLLQCRC